MGAEEEGLFIVLAGFDDCILGVVESPDTEDRLCYDQEKILGVLMNRDGMTREEAQEYFDFNMAGPYPGWASPCFLVEMPDRFD